VVVSDVAQQIMMINRAAVRLLGLESDTLLSETVSQLENRLGAELKLGAGGDGFTFQSNPLGADGRIVRGSVAPVQLPSGRGIGTVIVFRDVTSELRAEQAKSDFLATVSHELRTPLTSIKGYSELLAGGMAGDLPGPMKRFLRMIATNADRMAHLVDNILYVSEAERGVIPINPRAVELSEVVEEAVKAAAPAFAERDITCEVQLEPELPLMDVDPPRLRQVLDNILQNACKYTPAGGHVWLTARRCPQAGSAPSRSVEEGRDYVLIAVRDTGVGIRPEDRERIFERFYRSPNPLMVEAGGTGIGLTIVKSLVEAHGGRVWVDSAENVGSTFSILLPIQKEAPRAALRSRAA
jgi:PAS domain S-box-containing protein